MNAPVKTITVKDILLSREFLQGYRDAGYGFPFYKHYDKLSRPGQWLYERGRQFYFAAGPIRIFNKDGVTSIALSSYVKLRSNKSIV
jgi:hypothetical protein